MSHVAEVDLYVKDLEALKGACKSLGLEFRENQQTFRWYGRYMGDSRLPDGFTPEELGKCEHAIGVSGSRQAYEIGVLRRRDGKPGFILHYDNWNGGYGLEERVGRDACRLKQEYAAQVGAKHLRRQGYRVQRTVGSDGRVRLVGSK